jgi:hypothetical protein
MDKNLDEKFKKSHPPILSQRKRKKKARTVIIN